MADIKLLDKSVYELIAAGEVIERPSSVIKELVENDIDAGASRITVEIKNGGITFMRVTDNGCGIPFEQVSTAFLRHATSKLSAAEQLDNIMTLGFRGEALASVAAVGRVEVLTKCSEDELGTSYHIEGGEETAYEKTGCPDGTTVIIRDIFFNTPARLKFMKKDVTEGNYVQAVVDRLALVYPEIAFSFIRDNKTVRITSGDGKMYSSIYSVFGRQFAASLTQVDYQQNGIKINGYISVPHACRANRQMQYFFINRRSVRNATCMAALEEGYRNSVMVGKFPACVLNIEIAPSEVDVNVSPSKTEVRFSNDKMIFEAVYLAVKNGILNAENIKEIEAPKPALNTQTAFAEDDGEDDKIPVVVPKPKPFNQEKRYFDTVKEPSYHPDESTSTGNVALNATATVYKSNPPQNIFIQEKLDEDIDKAETTGYEFISNSSLIRKECAEEDKPQISNSVAEQEYEQPIKYIGELFKTYIICEQGENVILIDKHAAHERIRFEQLKKELVTTAQLLTESVSLTLSAEEWTALADNADYLSELGIESDFLDDFKVEVTAFPSMLSDWSVEDTMQKIAEVLIGGGDNIEGELYDDILHSVACKGAIKAHEYTSSQELEILAKRIMNDKSIRYCPHGRPIVTTVSKREIEKNFGRIQ